MAESTFSPDTSSGTRQLGRSPVFKKTDALADGPTSRLPAEVLAACFAFLSLRDLISASHVSQFWRSAALAFPALWCQIRICWTLPDARDLLHMAMSRAGELPVDFEYRLYYLPPSWNTLSALSHHMHRFRSMAWNASAQNLDLTKRAPLLQSLDLDPHFHMLPRNFLGGEQGSLRTLRVGTTLFPETCPALTTLTELRASCPWYVDGDPGFHRIFALCPQLEVLHLHDVHSRPEGALPAGPPPPTLRAVTLHARANFDLVRLYNASTLTSVPRVRLELPLATAYSPAPFLRDALDLCVVFDADDSTATVTAAMPDARAHTLVLDELESASRPAVSVAEILREMETATVRSLRVLLSVLSHVLSKMPHWDWPRVTRLTVDVFESYTPGEALSNSRWESRLECLCELSQRFPAVTVLLLSVHSRDDECSLLVKDPRALVQALPPLGKSTLSEVHIQGFSADVALQMKAQPEAPSHQQIIFDA